MSTNKQIVKNLIFNIGSSVVNLFIMFFFTPYLIQSVGKEAYSFFPLVNNIINYSTIISTAIGSMAGRFITIYFYQNDLEKAKGYFNSVLVANIMLSVLFSMVFLLMTLFIDRILTVPDYLISDVQWLFAFASLSLIASLCTGVLSVGTFVKNRLDLSALSTVTVNLLRVGVIILLFALFRPTIAYMSVSAFIAALLGICFSVEFKRRLLPEITINPRVYFSFSSLKEIIGSGIWNSVNQLSNVLLQQLDLLITNLFISASATGDFAIAKTAPNLIYSFLGVASGAFLPNFNILYAQGRLEELMSEINKSIKVIGLLVGLPIGFLLVFSDSFFELWVPGQDTSTLYWLSAVSVAPMIFGASINPVFGVFTVTNRLRIPSLVLLGAGISQTAIVFVLLQTTSLGIWAIALTSAVQGGIRNFFFTPIYAARCLRRSWYAFYPALFRGILGMLVVIGVGYVIRKIIFPENWLSLFTTALVLSAASLLINFYILLSKGERIYLLEKFRLWHHRS